MKNRKFKIGTLLSLIAISVVCSSPSIGEEIIPRSVQGDRGRYYLLWAKELGGVIQTLHKRVGVDSVGYTKAEINCQNNQMRELGYSEDGAEKIKESATKWFNLVPGSSKSDLALFVCSRRR